MPHKVKLDPTSIKNPMLRLDCAGTLPPRASCSQAVAARGAPEREVDTLPPPASPRGSGRPEGVWWRHRGRIAEKSSPNASSRWPKCASARASRAGAEGARRDTMPGGGGALATVHSGKSQAATGQHDGSALLQPGLTCTGRTEAVLSSGARRRIWANFDRRHSSPRARSDKMLTVRKLRLVERKRLPCEPAAGWLVVDCSGDFYGFLCS